MPTKPKRPVLPTVEGIPSLVSAFSEEEYIKGIAILMYKAAGIDDVLKIPKLWRQSKIIGILKQGKDSDSNEL